MPDRLSPGLTPAFSSRPSSFLKPASVLANLKDSMTVLPPSSTADSTWNLFAMSIPM